MRIGDCRKRITTAEGELTVFSLRELERKGIIKDIGKMPYSIRVIVESMIRQRNGSTITDDDVMTIASWSPDADTGKD
ncbi:MAG: hypothetical protein PHX42_05045, partial [Candidatus Methanomethylophilaceae archaeon]|nr:hypothetical protein [Candidatus Methanomethylophilaceae archaeon]